MRQKWAGALGIAYFQAFTNTYAPCDVLRSKYEEALRVPDIVGLDIATRADCLEQSTVEYLAELAERTYLTVELGLQTVHDRTAKIINRGHTFAEFLDGYTRLRNASPKINIAVHLINGLPNEDNRYDAGVGAKGRVAAPRHGQAASVIYRRGDAAVRIIPCGARSTALRSTNTPTYLSDS